MKSETSTCLYPRKPQAYRALPRKNKNNKIFEINISVYALIDFIPSNHRDQRHS